MGLATTDDFELLTGKSSDEQIAALLEVASAAVLSNAHDQQILEGDTTATYEPVGGVVRLPQRPVTAVASVTYSGAVVAETGYRWTEGGNGRPAYLVRRIAGIDDYWAGPVTVTYTHGWAADAIPETVKAAIVMLTVQLKQLIADGGREVTQESIDDYRRAFATGDQPLPGWIQGALDSMFGVADVTSINVVRDR